MVVSTDVKMVTSIERLREILPEPGPDSSVRRKELRFIDAHARNFIARSPFAVLSTAGPDGRCDATPRGDAPGFVKVLDDTTLLIPDRPGNRRLDSMENILANPHAGLLFMIPGMEETLRVNGRAMITEDRRLLEPLAMQGKVPLLGIIIEVEEVYFHCARAFRRSRLWQPDTWIDRSEMPTLGQIVADQLKLGDSSATEIDERLEKANKNLY